MYFSHPLLKTLHIWLSIPKSVHLMLRICHCYFLSTYQPKILSVAVETASSASVAAENASKKQITLWWFWFWGTLLAHFISSTRFPKEFFWEDHREFLNWIHFSNQISKQLVGRTSRGFNKIIVQHEGYRKRCIGKDALEHLLFSHSPMS